MTLKGLNRDQVYVELTPVFREVFENENLALSDAMTAKDVPQWDSLIHISLIFAVEKRFDIRFEDRGGRPPG